MSDVLDGTDDKGQVSSLEVRLKQFGLGRVKPACLKTGPSCRVCLANTNTELITKHIEGDS